MLMLARLGQTMASHDHQQDAFALRKLEELVRAV
jgi:hypothetical protein